MIPRSISRPFGRPSPVLAEVDLAKLINRTIALAVSSHHELGFATVSVGCDGRKRTTFIDGSNCQVVGEVCIAQRQDGISSCIDTPSQGNGMVVQSITFVAPVCSPVTGWHLLDSAGYLYRIPEGLITAAPYWPPVAPPSGIYDLVRAGTWATLMCAAALAPVVLNGDGGSTWIVYLVEGDPYATVQGYKTAVGGTLTHLHAVPSLTPTSGQIVVGTFSARWLGYWRNKATTTTVSLSQQDVNSATLAAGEEYKVLLWAQKNGTDAITVVSLKGVKGPAGNTTVPDNPSPLLYIELGVANVAYGGTVTTVSSGTTAPLETLLLRDLGGWPFASRYKWCAKGLVLRDADAPNAGMRYASLTLPTAGSGVVTGAIRAAWGYPLAFGPSTSDLDGGAPWGISGSASAGQLASRNDYDMAPVYGPPRVAVEYGPYHVNISGPEIATPDAWDLLSTHPGDEDTSANILALPDGELAVLQPYTDGGSPIVPPTFKRYRVRPAHDTAPTVTVAQAALDMWPNDVNEWVQTLPRLVVPWTVGDTSFTLQSGTWTHGRPVRVAVWQSNTATHYTLDATAKLGTLQQPTGGVATVAFDDSGGAPARLAGDGLSTCRITAIGTAPIVTYGSTFTYKDPVTLFEYESALSPLSEPTEIVARLAAPAAPLPDDLWSTTLTYSLTIGVALGPTNTVRRSIYRFAYDADAGLTAGVRVSPWHPDSVVPGTVYDRMCVLVGTIEDNVTADWEDTVTTFSFSGTRPPSPVIEVGSGITFDVPGRPFALPPVNL